MIIDAHQHFWKTSRSDYGWLTPAAGVLYRDYLPEDLTPLLSANAVSRTILIQAAPTEAETQFLFSLAARHPFVGGVVGWADFERADVRERIAALVAAGQGKLKGLRPMIQDAADPGWIARRELDAAFEAMIAHDLVFEALVRPIHLAALRDRLLRHPHLRAVLDHAGKPDIAGGGLDRWAADLARLASESAVCCKFSGLLSEAGRNRTPQALEPYAAAIFTCFGTNRIVWGSDWPVLNAVGSYAGWLDIARALMEQLAPGGASEVLAGTAKRLYRLP